MITRLTRALAALAATGLALSPIAAMPARADVGSSMDGFLNDMNGAANINGQQAIMARQYPRRHEMDAANQPRFIGMMADRHEFNLDAFAFQQDQCAPDGKLANAAFAQAATDRNALRILPALGAAKAANNARQFLREILNRAVDNAGTFRVAIDQHLIKLFLAQFCSRCFTEGIVVNTADALAPIFKYRLKRARLLARSPRNPPSGSSSSRLQEVIWTDGSMNEPCAANGV